MPNSARDMQSFEDVQARLDQIVAAVADEDLPLDQALDLYEEAVSLGMRASDLLEDGIEVDEEALAADAPALVDDAAAPTAGAPVAE